MDSRDLIARENEFKKLNKQLEKKSETLIKEIENVMQKQDIFSDFSHKLTLSPVHKVVKRHCSSSSSEKEYINNESTKKDLKKKAIRIEKDTSSKLVMDSKEIKTNGTDILNTKCNCNCYILSDNKKQNEDLEFLYAFVSVGVIDNVLPQSFLKDNLSVESICKFLSSKVKLMQEQIDKLQGTIDNKVKQCDGHMTQLAELESERLSLINKANSMRSETADMKAKYATVQNRLNEKDRLYKEQRSSADKLTAELKQLRSKNASLEARCASQEEIVTTLKQQVLTAKLTEKEFRDSTRTLSASHQTIIQRLEARIKSLKVCTNRQTALIDNLRKQNSLLRTEGAVKALGQEYFEFLKQDL